MMRRLLFLLGCLVCLTAAPAMAQTGFDAFVGTFSDGRLTVILTRSGSRYSGTARMPEGRFNIAAQKVGSRLVGTYTVDGQEYNFEAQVRGTTMTLATDDETYTLKRREAASPVQPSQGPPAQGASGGSAADGQLSQLLLGSKWCHFSYRGSTNNSGSGTSYQESVVFGQDGTAQVRTGGENHSSGNNGSVNSQSSGGQTIRWKVQQGALHLSEDGVQWDAVALQVSQNSNGYPIVTAGEKEYAQC